MYAAAAPYGDKLSAMAEGYRKAAEKGKASAQSALATMYQQGSGGVAQNYTLAAEWYRKAADQGSKRAQVKLGDMYAKGLGGVPLNTDLAADLYRKAADQGVKLAKVHLAQLERLQRRAGRLPSLLMNNATTNNTNGTATLRRIVDQNRSGSYGPAASAEARAGGDDGSRAAAAKSSRASARKGGKKTERDNTTEKKKHAADGGAKIEEEEEEEEEEKKRKRREKKKNSPSNHHPELSPPSFGYKVETKCIAKGIVPSTSWDEDRHETCAAFTVVQNERVLLPLWLRYYSRHIATGDLWVLDHGTTDKSTDAANLPEGVHVKTLTGTGGVPLDNEKYNNGNGTTTTPVDFFMEEQVTKQMHYLLGEAGYACVVFSQVDEFILPDPEVYPGGLKEYLAAFIADEDRTFVRAMGMEILQEKKEPRINWCKSITKQRHKFRYRASHNKPLITKTPLVYGRGFEIGMPVSSSPSELGAGGGGGQHDAFTSPQNVAEVMSMSAWSHHVDITLALFNLRYVDHDYCLAREYAKQLQSTVANTNCTERSTERDCEQMTQDARSEMKAICGRKVKTKKSAQPALALADQIYPVKGKWAAVEL